MQAAPKLIAPAFLPHVTPPPSIITPAPVTPTPTMPIIVVTMFIIVPKPTWVIKP